MFYTEEQIQKRTDAIKEHFGLKQVLFKKQSNEILFFEALGNDKTFNYLRLNSDGKLFRQMDGKWTQIVGFLLNIDEM